MRNSQNGNVLWFILIAVALLGMLTMVLSRSGSVVDQSGDIEQLRISGGQILRYAKSLESGIQEMTLRGVSENDISFENAAPAIAANANCTTTACRVFHVEGAGLSYKEFNSANSGADWIFTGANNVGTTAGPVGSTADGTGNDLIMLMPDISSDLCIQINRDLGVGTPGTLPVETTGIDTTVFDGTYPTGGPTLLDGDPTPFELNRKTAGCFVDANDSDKVYFYYVLLPR